MVNTLYIPGRSSPYHISTNLERIDRYFKHTYSRSRLRKGHGKMLRKTTTKSTMCLRMMFLRSYSMEKYQMKTREVESFIYEPFLYVKVEVGEDWWEGWWRIWRLKTGTQITVVLLKEKIDMIMGLENLKPGISLFGREIRDCNYDDRRKRLGQHSLKWNCQMRV